LAANLAFILSYNAVNRFEGKIYHAYLYDASIGIYERLDLPIYLSFACCFFSKPKNPYRIKYLHLYFLINKHFSLAGKINCKHHYFISQVEWLEAASFMRRTAQKYGNNRKNSQIFLDILSEIDEILNKVNVDIETSIDAISLALDIHFHLYQITSDQKYLDNAIKHCQSLMDSGYELILRDRFALFVEFAEELLSRSKWNEAISLYELIEKIGGKLRQWTIWRTNKEDWVEAFQSIGPNQALAYAKQNNATAAVESLERNLANLYHDELDLRSKILKSLVRQEKISGDMALSYERNIQRWNELAELRIKKIASEEEITELFELRNSLEEMRNTFETFNQNFSLSRKMHFKDSKASLNSCCLYIVPNQFETFALQDSSKGPRKIIWLESKKSFFPKIGLKIFKRRPDKQIPLPSSEQAEVYVGKYKQFIAAYNDNSDLEGGVKAKEYLDALDDMCNSLGQLMRKCRNLSWWSDRIVIIPVGYLSFFPLHVGWTAPTRWEKFISHFTSEKNQRNKKRRYVCDDMNISYAPSMSSLQRAQETLNEQTVSSEKIVAVHSPKYLTGGNLDGVGQLCNDVVSHFEHSKVLYDEAATHDGILDELENMNIFHFSWHGTSNFEDPLNKSGLVVYEGENESEEKRLLSIKNLLGKDFSHLRLSVLSACETGLRGEKLPDEAISMSTGLMAAGSAGVISALWAVPITPTNAMIARFYELWRKEKLEPVESLRKAQIELRDGVLSVEKCTPMLQCGTTEDILDDIGEEELKRELELVKNSKIQIALSEMRQIIHLCGLHFTTQDYEIENYLNFLQYRHLDE
jgi:hypothetical protein